MFVPTFFDFSMVNEPADLAEGAYMIYFGGILYNLEDQGQDPGNAPYAVCANCETILKYHISFKCPFEPTQFCYVYEG